MTAVSTRYISAVGIGLFAFLPPSPEASRPELIIALKGTVYVLQSISLLQISQAKQQTDVIQGSS